MQRDSLVSKSTLQGDVSKTCDACNASYIDKTVNTLRERFISGANAHLKFDQQFESPFKLHLREKPTHYFDRDKIQVLDTSPYNLETKESPHISYPKPPLNTDTKSGPPPLFQLHPTPAPLQFQVCCANLVGPRNQFQYHF